MKKICATMLAAAMATMLFPSANAHAQAEYPNRTIRFLVPHTAGGMVDTVSRTVAQHLSNRLGQPVVVENRLGAVGSIAMEALAKAPADGYTLVLGTSTNFVLLPASRKSLPYDPVKDFASVTMISTAPLYLVGHPSLPARTLSELIAYAKSHPGKLNYASNGPGGSEHLAMEMFKDVAQLDIVHVPYKGSSPAITDLLAGNVQVMFLGPTSTLPHIMSGKLKVFASAGLHRTVALPDVPTVSESGFSGFEGSTWSGLVTTAGVPRPILNRLNAVIGEMIRSPEIAKQFAANNIELIFSSPEQMDERIRKEIPLFAKVMRAAGIQPN